jgi:hypothetical protein
VIAVAPARFGSITSTNQRSFDATPCPVEQPLEVGEQEAAFAGQLHELSESPSSGIGD